MSNKQLTILYLLAKGETITSLEAFKRFKITRLASIIHCLREKGHVINSLPLKIGETSFAQYKYVSPPDVIFSAKKVTSKSAAQKQKELEKELRRYFNMCLMVTKIRKESMSAFSKTHGNMLLIEEALRYLLHNNFYSFDNLTDEIKAKFLVKKVDNNNFFDFMGLTLSYTMP